MVVFEELGEPLFEILLLLLSSLPLRLVISWLTVFFFFWAQGSSSHPLQRGLLFPPLIAPWFDFESPCVYFVTRIFGLYGRLQFTS